MAVAREREPMRNWSQQSSTGTSIYGDETLRPQDTSAPRHFGTSAEVPTTPKCLETLRQDTSAPLSVTYTRRRASQSLNTEQCRPLSLT